MSPSVVEETIARRTPARQGRLLLCTAAILFAALLMAGIGLARREHLKTYVSGRVEKIETRFALDYPDEWHESIEINPGNATASPAAVLLRHSPPTGMARWWRQHILHRDLDGWQDDGIRVMLLPRENFGTFEEIERDNHLSGRQPNYSVTTRRFRLAIGPALECLYLAKPGPDAPPHLQTVRILYVLPDDTPEHRKIAVTVMAFSDNAHAETVQPGYETIKQHLRLIDGK